MSTKPDATLTFLSDTIKTWVRWGRHIGPTGVVCRHLSANKQSRGTVNTRTWKRSKDKSHKREHDPKVCDPNYPLFSSPLWALIFSKGAFPRFRATEPMGRGPHRGVLPCRVWVCAPPYSSKYQSPLTLIIASVMPDRFRISREEESSKFRPCLRSVPRGHRQSCHHTEDQIRAAQCWNCVAERSSSYADRVCSR